MKIKLYDNSALYGRSRGHVQKSSCGKRQTVALASWTGGMGGSRTFTTRSVSFDLLKAKVRKKFKVAVGQDLDFNAVKVIRQEVLQNGTKFYLRPTTYIEKSVMRVLVKTPAGKYGMVEFCNRRGAVDISACFAGQGSTLYYAK